MRRRSLIVLVLLLLLAACNTPPNTPALSDTPTPTNPSVLDTAGWLLVETGGDRNRALDLLRRAARQAPANRTIAAHLATAEKG